MVPCSNSFEDRPVEDKPKQMHSEGSTPSVAIYLNKRRLCLRNYNKYTGETASCEKI